MALNTPDLTKNIHSNRMWGFYESKIKECREKNIVTLG